MTYRFGIYHNITAFSCSHNIHDHFMSLQYLNVYDNLKNFVEIIDRYFNIINPRQMHKGYGSSVCLSASCYICFICSLTTTAFFAS
jgi:hypothetical protein